ncbi:sulfite exporter TauE/SafE family protein [Microbaculum marinum]|uniref:Probable membrane transporter protein n=1 Tax=Microbaculum marinum TaxID=1764581 RepID=A0AAW9RND2_9HYPH
MLVIAVMLAMGLASGFIAGFFAVTGSVIRVPLLLFLGGWLAIPPEMRMHVALATSLATALPTMLAAARAHARAGDVDWDIWRWFAPGAFAGAVVGTVAAINVHSNVVEIAYVVLIMPIGVISLARPAGIHLLSKAPVNIFGTLIQTVVGAGSALIALGGGVFNVMLLGGCGLPKDRVVGTSAAIAPAIVGPALAVVIIGGLGVEGLPAGQFGYVNLLGFVFITIGAMVAAPFGTRINARVPDRLHRRLYGLFVLAIAVNMLVHLLITYGVV